jgi:hypothetical protein
MGPEKRWAEAHLNFVRSLFYTRAAVKRQEYVEMTRESWGRKREAIFRVLMAVAPKLAHWGEKNDPLDAPYQ